MATEKGRKGQDESWALTLLLSDTSMFLFISHNNLASQSDIIADTVIISVLLGTHRPSPSWYPARFTKKGGESVAGWRETELSYLDI